MDGIRELLEAARENHLLVGHFRAFLHIAIGRTVTREDGSAVSVGITWRELAALLKALRIDRELVREYGADPETLSPRDREKFWYSAIAQARVDSAEAFAEAERLVGKLKALGYVVGAGAAAAPRKPAPSPPPPPPPASDKPGRKKKK